MLRRWCSVYPYRHHTGGILPMGGARVETNWTPVSNMFEIPAANRVIFWSDTNPEYNPNNIPVPEG